MSSGQQAPRRLPPRLEVLPGENGRHPYEYQSTRFTPGLPSGRSGNGVNALRFICSLPTSAAWTDLFKQMQLIRYLTGVTEFRIVGHKQGYPSGVYEISGSQESSLDCLLLAVCFVKITASYYSHPDVDEVFRKRKLESIIEHYKAHFFDHYGFQPQTIACMLLEILWTSRGDCLGRPDFANPPEPLKAQIPTSAMIAQVEERFMKASKSPFPGQPRKAPIVQNKGLRNGVQDSSRFPDRSKSVQVVYDRSGSPSPPPAYIEPTSEGDDRNLETDVGQDTIVRAFRDEHYTRAQSRSRSGERFFDIEDRSAARGRGRYDSRRGIGYSSRGRGRGIRGGPGAAGFPELQRNFTAISLQEAGTEQSVPTSAYAAVSQHEGDKEEKVVVVKLPVRRGASEGAEEAIHAGKVARCCKCHAVSSRWRKVLGFVCGHSLCSLCYVTEKTCPSCGVVLKPKESLETS